MDPLTEIIALAEPAGTVSRGLTAGGDWALAFPRHQGIKFMAIERGTCRIAVDGGEPARLQAGDCFLLATGRPFLLGSDLSLPPQDAGAVYARPSPGGVAEAGGGDAFLMAGLRFTLREGHARHLVDALPPIVHLRAEADQTQLRWSLQRIHAELRDRRPGGALVLRHHAQLLLVQALRIYLDGGAAGGGWLAALADPRLSKAMVAMHADPARRWTVATLASSAGMSRTAFAVAFRAATGDAPINYLTRWRMALAAERFGRGREKASTVAEALGYASESALGAAYRRVTGRAVRDGRLLGSP